MISFLVAMDKNRVIGKGNDLPWRLPEDLKYFKRVTMGRAIVMGRKTYESIGKPLPGRENIVITRNKDFQVEGVTVFHSVEEAVKEAKSRDEEVFFIGGGNIFEQTLKGADKLYITKIEESFDGDTFFPEIDPEEWKLVSQEKGLHDEKNPYEYYFQVYERNE
ncbi:dihydrofolate reductase [Bacillus tianshenii]|nr:dihydrofolate reductase [Bacillus tianshenii]